jgi:hypothetical protein
MDTSWALALASAGIFAGLVLLWRGARAGRVALQVADIATSRVSTLAAGEVRISGTVVPAEVLIESPLQGASCVWYRARVSRMGDRDGTVWDEERGIGFRVDDGSGSIRVFPRDAVLDVEDRFVESTGLDGDDPPGLATSRRPIVETAGEARLTYREARLEPGDVVTVVGSAVPFGHLADPSDADSLVGGGVGADDPEVAADIARARAAGQLVDREKAWGNAAIAGFGIERPISDPRLHPDARRPALATPEEAATMERTWDLRPDQLVLAGGSDGRLLIAEGAPGSVAERHRDRYLTGLLGAVLAIASAVAAAWLFTNPVGS